MNADRRAGTSRIAATDATGPPAPSLQPPQKPDVQQPNVVVGIVKQPSFRARPRRSCLRRRSTAEATTATAPPASDELSDTHDSPLPSTPVMARSVSFAENLTVQEYGMILGDHPGVLDNGYVLD